MASLTPERWSVVAPQLDRALDLAPEERAAWLETLRARDSALAAAVEALLAEHAALEREGFLAGDAAPIPERTSLAGLAVGAYTLRAPIGPAFRTAAEHLERALGPDHPAARRARRRAGS